MRTMPIASSPDAPTTRLATLRRGISCPRPNTTESLIRSLPADNQSRCLGASGFSTQLFPSNTIHARLPARATEAVNYPACEAFLQHAVDSFLVDPRLTSQFVCLSLVAQLRRKWQVAWPGGRTHRQAKCLRVIH